MFYTLNTLRPLCRRLHARNQRIVLATGFFDLLHQEHIRFLSQAKRQGDVLVVGVESDLRARQLKGEGRPIQTQRLRAEHLVPYVDYCLLLPDEFSSPSAHAALLDAVRPQVLAISSHTAHQNVKRALVAKYGGTLKIVHQHNPRISTTQLIKSHP